MFVHFIARSARDFVKSRNPRKEARGSECMTDEARLEAATHWLMRSIDVCGGRASSKGYRFAKGWMPPYPETSGYIIPTLLVIGYETGLNEYRDRAEAIGGWLASIQLQGGGFRAREVGVLDEPDVFDTGMILLGFNALIHEAGGHPVRKAAERAADFLVAAMNEEGCFVRHLSHGIVHAYNVRAAWGLVAYGILANEIRFLEAGLANARWTRAQQNASGYYENNAFKRGGNANTHGIAYVMQGLLQIHELTRDKDCFDSVVVAANALRAIYRERGWIAAELGPHWEYLSRHICLTGYAQLAIVFFRLFQMTGDESYRQTAAGLLSDAAHTQDLRSRSAPQYGAIAGSFPIYGRYAPLQYPNWATKFFVDALIAKRHVERGRQEGYPLQRYGG